MSSGVPRRWRSRGAALLAGRVRGSTRPEEGLVAFLHVPRTGGTTLNAIMRRHYRPREFYDHEAFMDSCSRCETFLMREWQCPGGPHGMSRRAPEDLTPRERSELRAVSGHHPYGFHRDFASTVRYFTMLRDPVERVISLYAYVPQLPEYEWVRGVTLEEFVRRSLEARNGQTRLLSGSTDADPDLERARRNLRNVDVVGTTECFDATLFLVSRELGWWDVGYTRVNVSPNRPAARDVPIEVRRLIEDANALDRELHTLAGEVLRKRLDALGRTEKKALRRFEAANPGGAAAVTGHSRS